LRTYYVMNNGTLLREGNTLYVKTDERKKAIPIQDIHDLYVMGEVTLNSKVINFLAQNGKVVHFFNYYGFYSSSLYPRETLVSGHVKVRQAEHYLNRRKRLKLAQLFVDGAATNIRRTLLYYQSRGRELGNAIESIEKESASIYESGAVDQLMGIEGRIRSTYYSCWNDILKEAPSFDKRKKRPPDNEVNALISFGNSLMYTATLSEIYYTQLDPTISFLHEPGTRRFSLSLDISEIFKPLVIDRMIFKLWNNGEIDTSDFTKKEGICLLSDKGRMTMVQDFDERMKTTIKHRKSGKHLTYRQLIRSECYRLIKHMIGDETYKPFKAWW